ncbi:MAG: heavy metal translocating P-type ATPase [Porticoccus sp.]|nr:heavy metal translocating P-type ATPase [Porticoccus sp.]
MSLESCYHCGLLVPANASFTVVIDGESRDMCCPGCQAVATAICDGGLSRFYQYRSSNASRPDLTKQAALEAYDLPEVQADYVEQLGNGHRQIQLLVGGITCAACAWLIEHHLKKQPGVVAVRVNVTNHRAMVEWDADQIKLSQLLSGFLAIGYDARPASDEEARQLRQHENRRFIQRLGVAGFGMMQAGMLAVGLYAGAFQGMDPEWQNYLRWVSLIFALPVVLFSAFPFFQAAWRNLRFAHLTMDVPVSLAIGLAFTASCWGTVTRSGEVYFDSVAMFTFFLLLGRYLEMRVRHRNDTHAEGMGQLLPPTTVRLSEQGEEAVPVKALQPGDLIRVAAGDTIPCDGEIHEGVSSVIEAVLTGEQMPVCKQQGDLVSAGTVNSESPLLVRVSAVGHQTRLSAILKLVEKAKTEKPVQVALADRVASHFVLAVLLVALVVALWWWQHQPDQALWVVLSVLVVTCPCALSLATPAAMAVATGELRRRGFLVSRGHVLEVLSSADQLIFDKTGTLTLGNMSIAHVVPLAEVPAERLLKLAAGLESGSLHPIARAFSDIADKALVRDVTQQVGAGISGTVENTQYAIGQPSYITELFGFIAPDLPTVASGQLPLLLADKNRPLGWVLLQDELRPGAACAITRLRAQGIEVSLLSGDRQATVDEMAEKLGITERCGGMSPEQKLAEANRLQKAGHRVIMVGDGINDVPVLSGADASVAMGDATDFARIHADSILLSSNLDTLPKAITLARKTRRVIQQNLGWALCYNLLALPLAAAGMIPPWAAAIGMSVSSLLVVLNALRLNHTGD